MSLFDEFKKYRDQYGMNQLSTNGTVGDTSQNGALFSLEYLICLLEDDSVPQHIKDAEVKRLIPVYLSLERFPGVSVRFPGSDEFDSMDNTGAIAAFSGCFDNGGYSKRSHEHSEKTFSKEVHDRDKDKSLKYLTLARVVTGVMSLFSPPMMIRWIKSGFAVNRFWNNNDPSKYCFRGWHGRSPGHVAFLKLSAGKLIGPLSFLSILVGQFIGPFKETGDTDARKLPYTHWYFLTKCTHWSHRWIWRLFYKLWVFILMKQYPEGMKTIYSIYYRDPNHPIRKYSKPHFKP